ncbi:hypothetical protein SAMN05216357_12815 [Porphyromonadaceae bacterium KH3CP3RA]|nr:hypothetical protein SAMN05216357_12815 [Porphyromonadaceae bacterium KH3CP3RA]
MIIFYMSMASFHKYVSIDSTKKDEENTMEKYYRQTELLHL